MEVFEAIKKRRSIRKYKKEEVPKEALLKLVEAGIWAPTSGNIQAWEFIITKKKESIGKIKIFSPGLIGEPAALIILCTNRREAYEKGGELGRDILCLMDISMAAQNILLEATEIGLGSCPVRSFNQAAIKKLLDLPNEVIPELIISIGYQAESPKPPAREMDKVIHLERWK
ncbi:MAG TPA: nitroreductase family protein [Thermoplasmata archaeon]|mgnify:CR=1 FL=1|nr:nitroreductase family protein [Thermoplasmata archaeon]